MHPSLSTNLYCSIYVFICSPSSLIPLTHPAHLSFSLIPFPQGIGRMILKEEMKARSGRHDNDQWGSRRSSRCSSKETLNNVGYGSLNGCKSTYTFLDWFLLIYSLYHIMHTYCVWQRFGQNASTSNVIRFSLNRIQLNKWDKNHTIHCGKWFSVKC